MTQRRLTSATCGGVELDNGTYAGEIALNDHLENGVGFTAWLSQDSNWSRILDLITGPGTMMIPSSANFSPLNMRGAANQRATTASVCTET